MPKSVRFEARFRRLEKNGSGSNRRLYAALDLGTNSCRMLIAKPEGFNFAIVDAFSKSVRLGLDLERTGVLSQLVLVERYKLFTSVHEKFVNMVCIGCV